MVQLSEILDGAAEWREILEGAAPDLPKSSLLAVVKLHCSYATTGSLHFPDFAKAIKAVSQLIFILQAVFARLYGLRPLSSCQACHICS